MSMSDELLIYIYQYRFTLYLVVFKGLSIFESFTVEDKSLLIGKNSFSVLDIGFEVLTMLDTG